MQVVPLVPAADENDAATLLNIYREALKVRVYVWEGFCAVMLTCIKYYALMPFVG